MHRAFIDIAVDRARSMVFRAKSIQKLQHQGLKGALREAFVRDLLRPLLPVEYVIGQGEIISAYEETSNQIDVVISDASIIPTILIDQNAGIFPVETTLATIEIKSKLNFAELFDAERSAQRVAKFRHAPPVGANQFPKNHKIEHVIPCVLAFDTDLAEAGKTELQRYLDVAGEHGGALKVLCVVGRGLWVHNSTSGWHSAALRHEYGEITGLICAIINSCRRVSATRSQPDLRQYLDGPSSLESP